MAIALFVDGAKGMSALQLSRDLNVQYKSAFVLAKSLIRSASGLGDELRGKLSPDRNLNARFTLSP